VSLRVFVVGYKNHARRVVKSILRSQLCSEIFVYHPEIEKLNEIEDLGSSIRRTNDLTVAIKCSCVFICSPSNTHISYLKELLRLSSEHGCEPYIYCEKPVAVTLKEVEWLETNFSRFAARLKVGFNFLYSDFVIEASSCIGNNSIGKPISAFFQVSHGLASKKDFASNWRARDTNPFSQLVGNLSIHYIHASQYLFGKVKNFFLSESNAFASENPDSMSLSLHHECGVHSHIFCSYATVFTSHFSLYFTDGLLDQTSEGLVLMSPRDTFNEAGEFTLPPKIFLSKQSAQRDVTLDKSINNFLQDALNNVDFGSIELMSAIEASKLVIEVTSKTFHPSRQ